MLALALTVFSQTALANPLGDRICLELEAGTQDTFWDDEVDEDSIDKVCAWQDNKESQKVCRTGVYRNPGMDVACIYFPAGTLNYGRSYFVETHGSDAVWMDRVYAAGAGWVKSWGADNEQGWCLSKDRNDHLDWNNDGLPQHVTDGQCYYKIKFGQKVVSGYPTTSQAKLCREEKTMGCKQGCPSGWKHVGTTEHGCCSSWGSCFGNKKVCQRDVECRRRVEAEGADATAPSLTSAESGVAQRFLEAGLRESESTFEVEVDVVSTLAESMPIDQETDTKHFVLENGDWVQLSQDEAKGMTMIADEADEVLPEVSEDARRRWSRVPLFPGWPSGLQRCRDEMTMPCNMPCNGGGWSVFVEMENGCCMNGPGGIDHPKPCGFTTKICQKFYLCWYRSG